MARLILLLALAVATIAISQSEARIQMINTIIHAADPPYRRINKPTFQGGAWAPTPSHRDFYYKICLRKVSDVCGKEIYNSIFVGDETHHVSPECCGQMVSMGHHCHERLVSATLALPELEGKNKDEISQRDAEVWKRCVKVTDILSSFLRRLE